MADIHVLTGNGKGRWSVVFHFPVPDIVNAAAVNYRAALANSGLGGTTAMPEGTGPGQISAAEKALVESGAVYEQGHVFLVESNGAAPAAIRIALRQTYAREQTECLADLQHKLRYFGHTESKE